MKRTSRALTRLTDEEHEELSRQVREANERSAQDARVRGNG
ncbi:hypothetical protein SALCHL_003189 [Streptomyces albus subsp. chlorinus]|nr:hypothetical protein [Streptomyces albus]